MKNSVFDSPPSLNNGHLKLQISEDLRFEPINNENIFSEGVQQNNTKWINNNEGPE